MKRLPLLALGWIVIVLAVVGVHIFIPQRVGPHMLSEIFEPYIVLTGLLATPFALRAEQRWKGAAIGVLVAVSLLRYGPAWVSLPSTVAGDPLTVVAWNIEAGPDAGQRALDGLLNLDADLVGLQELQPAAADALSGDQTLAVSLPYRALAPERTVLGVGLLSRYPILEHQESTDPPLMRAVVDPQETPPIAVYVVHPLPARFVTVYGLPVSIDTTVRDEAVVKIRTLIEADLAEHRPVIVLGDINTTEREPAYADLAAGLRDAHLDAGLGPGFTWRPPQLGFLPFGLLRIDYVLVSPEYVAESSFVDCDVASDHCLLQAKLIRPRLEF